MSLRAACGPSAAAAQTWNQLLRNVAFDELSDNTQRLAPSIYRNVRSESGILEKNRLKGAFKHHWSKNTRLLFECGSVIRALNEEGIPYRVLKGAAVQTTTGSIGSRVMGDLDLLVHAADAKRVEELLHRHGFRRSSYSVCPFHGQENLLSAMDFNREDVHIDVHLAELKEPRELLLKMLQEPGIVVKGPCGNMHLPEPELLVLHACVHGKLASGGTDFIQALLDVAMLRPTILVSALEQYALATHTVYALDMVDRQLQAWSQPVSGAKFTRSDRARQRLKGFFRSAPNLLTYAGSVGRRIHQRRRGPETVKSILTSFPGQRHKYAAWILSGQFAVIERAAAKLWGGFLSEPVAPARKAFNPFDIGGFSGTASNVAFSTLDWRFRITFDDENQRRWLQFEASALDRLDAFVFVNGVPTSRIVAGDSASRVVGIFGVGSSAEVSLRPLWQACTACFGGFEDLRVSVIT
jgi:hypothetical protein